MTKEELREEATFTVEWECTTMIDRPLFVHGYITGAEPREERIAELEKENAELKEKVSYLEDNLRVARKDREKLQLDVAKGLKEFVKDYPATAFRYLANEEYVEQLTKAKEIIKDYMIIVKGGNITACSVPEENRCINVLKLNEQAKQFLSEVEQC